MSILQNNPVIVSGNIQEIREKLEQLKSILAYRQSAGYPVLQADEEWMFHDMHDTAVCLDCHALDGIIFQGDVVASQFPFYQFESAISIFPHIQNSFHSSSRCRCSLEWINVTECIQSRIYNEMVLAVG